MSEKIKEYGDFWPYYLRQHAKPLTRGLHYIGTALAILFVALGVMGNGVYFAGVPLAGYGFAWAAHFFVEKNKPATFTYPLWSLYSDCRMFGLFITWRLRQHLNAAGISAALAAVK